MLNMWMKLQLRMCDKRKRRHVGRAEITEKADCQVCGRQTRAYFYKLYVCCACTMFYRRNFRSYPRSQCRFQDENCNLRAGPRRFCLRCRLTACRRLGLRMWGKNLVVQANGLPVDDIPEEHMDLKLSVETDDAPCTSGSVCSPASSTSSGYSTGHSTITCASPFCGDTPNDYLWFTRERMVELPQLRQVTKMFRLYDEQQKFLSSMQANQELFDFTANDSIYMDLVQFNELEEKAQRAICILLTQFVTNFELSKEDAISLIRACVLDFSIHHKIFNSQRTFSENKRTVSFFAGYHTFVLDMESFLADVVAEESYRMLETRFTAFMNLFYNLVYDGFVQQVHPVEYAYILSRTIAQRASELNIDSQIIGLFSSRLATELLQFLEISQAPGDRFVQLTLFCNRIRDLSAAFSSLSDISCDVVKSINREYIAKQFTVMK